MNCETCKAKLPTLKTRLTRVNDALHYLGTYYHNTLPLHEINDILTLHGFQEATFGQAGSVHEEVGEGKWLSMTFHRMDCGSWEVVAYVN